MKHPNQNTTERTQCYGRIFPDLSAARVNTPHRGKVFAVTVSSRGIGLQGEEQTADEDAWEACTQCQDFDDCYKLSMARLAFHNAVRAGLR